MSLYPKKIDNVEIVKLNRSDVVASVITTMDGGLTKAQAIGIVLNGSDDIDTFNEVWDSIETQGKAARAVSVASFTTDTDYKAAVEKGCRQALGGKIDPCRGEQLHRCQKKHLPG